MARQEILERLADSHEAQIKKTLENLEADIISGISKATNDDNILTTKISIDLRKDLKQYMEQYRIDTDTLVRDYDQIVNSFMEEFGQLNIPDKFKSLTEVDLLTINQLKFQSFSGFEEIANRYLTEISANVYQNAIAGKPFNEMVKDIRGLITGDVDRRGRSMSTYASQIAHDSVMQFDGQFTVFKAKEAGLDKYKYTGTLVRDSRDHCKTHVGRTYTEEQIRAIWQGSWAGKSEGDPFIVRGGYRCRHTWIPIVEVEEDDILEEEQEDINNGFNVSKNNFYESYENNVSAIPNVMNKLEGQQISNKKISDFINAHGITNLLIPRDINKKAFRSKEFPKIKKRYDKNLNKEDSTYVLNRIDDLEIDEMSLVYRKRNIGGWATPAHNAPITFIDQTIDFKNLDTVAIQTNTKKVIERTKNNKGKYETKGGYNEKKNADWSFSSQSTSKEEKALKTMLHELGHHVHYYSYKTDIGAVNTRMDIFKILKDDQKKNMILTKYGEYNKYEVHAELFTAYATNRTALSKYNKGLVEYMDKLLDEAIKNKTKGH